MRLGALELLANIYSGRITASDKDPFPHQLALQQYVKDHESRLQRVLIADEVGLGKTIEVGLLLRDRMIADPENFRCLYLTSGGLKEDVKEKLRSVIKDSGGETLITVVDSFKNYGDQITQKFIRIASMHAAKRYIDGRNKKILPRGVKPNVIIIDECHHCASSESFSGEPEDRSGTTQAYIAAYQIISGKFWLDSEPPELVILMSATPFRSDRQFTNLLRLLVHQTNTLDNAYFKSIEQQHLLEAIKKEDSSASIIWRQQDEIRNWSNKRLFPQLTIVRPHRDGEPALEKTDEAYLSTLKKIKKTVQRIHKDHGKKFGGFATAHLETRLTSSSLAGACWLFRWCVRHYPKWANEKVYTSDNSDGAEGLRTLIREISKNLSKFDEKREIEYAKEVVFPSDGNFSFSSGKLREGKIPAIWKFQKKLQDDDDDDSFAVTSEEVLELVELALSFLEAGKLGNSVENAKLNWLQAMMETHPDSRFLVFTEVLQTTTIIKAYFPTESLALTGGTSGEDRKDIVKKFYDRNQKYRILVATSAADEGLDFQVANKIVHWDLSPDPSVLMQRNGRVARLGQISDVTAYYLILEGTLAEKRDTALLERLEKANITDPRLQGNIIGQIDVKEFDKAINDDEELDEKAVDQILKSARKNNDQMEQAFRQLCEKELHSQWVLDREKLLNRLKKWHILAVTQYDVYKHKLTFESQEWQRPIFTESGTTMEDTTSEILAITHHKNKKDRFNFDPEFGLFSQNNGNSRLAGLLPWYLHKKESIIEHKAILESDPIGTLTQSLARQRQADFMAISKNSFESSFPSLNSCFYLLFVTHPLRELENNYSSQSAKYLTYYAFTINFEQPINPGGASATEVHQVITFLEDQILQGVVSLSSEEIITAKLAAQNISKWIRNSFRMETDMFGDSTYFVPIPVALIAIVDNTLQNKEDG